MAGRGRHGVLHTPLGQREVRGARGDGEAWDRALLARLARSGTLRAHRGCVNTLWWSDDGELLLSAGDDLDIHLWQLSASRTRPVGTMHSYHEANIFSAKFSDPLCHHAASCAGDGCVHLYDVRRECRIAYWRAHGDEANKLAPLPSSSRGSPIVLSCGSDGAVCVNDFRASAPHRLLRCRIAGKPTPIRLDSIALNSTSATVQVTVCGAMPYVHTYDVRRPDTPLLVFAPSSRPVPRELLTTMGATGCSISADGTRLLVTYSPPKSRAGARLYGEDSAVRMFDARGSEHAHEDRARRRPILSASGGGGGGGASGASGIDGPAAGRAPKRSRHAPPHERRGEHGQRRRQGRRGRHSSALDYAEDVEALEYGASLGFGSFAAMEAAAAREAAEEEAAAAHRLRAAQHEPSWLAAARLGRQGGPRADTVSPVADRGADAAATGEGERSGAPREQRDGSGAEAAGAHPGAARGGAWRPDGDEDSSGSSALGESDWDGSDSDDSSNTDDGDSDDAEDSDSDSDGGLGASRHVDQDGPAPSDGSSADSDDADESLFRLFHRPRLRAVWALSWPHTQLGPGPRPGEEHMSAPMAGAAGVARPRGRQLGMLLPSEALSGHAGLAPAHGALLQVFRAHISMLTVKEVSFGGTREQWVISGSDDGGMYVWACDTGALLFVEPRGDRRVTNCAQPRPRHPLLIATSGIDRSVKLFEPIGRERRPISRTEHRAQLAMNRALTRDALERTTLFTMTDSDDD